MFVVGCHLGNPFCAILFQSLALYTVTHEFLCQEMDKLATGTERLVEEPKYSASDETKRTDPKIPSEFRSHLLLEITAEP